MIRGPFFLSSSQKDPNPEHRRKYSGIYPETSFNHDSKYVIKNFVSPTQKQIQASKVGNSEFRALGKNSEWEPMESHTMEQNTESSLKDDSEYWKTYMFASLFLLAFINSFFLFYV